MIKIKYKDVDGKESMEECTIETLIRLLREKKSYEKDFKQFPELDLIKPENIGVISINIDGYLITDVSGLASNLTL